MVRTNSSHYNLLVLLIGCPLHLGVLDGAGTASTVDVEADDKEREQQACSQGQLRLYLKHISQV